MLNFLKFYQSYESARYILFNESWILTKDVMQLWFLAVCFDYRRGVGSGIMVWVIYLLCLVRWRIIKTKRGFLFRFTFGHVLFHLFEIFDVIRLLRFFGEVRGVRHAAELSVVNCLGICSRNAKQRGTDRQCCRIFPHFAPLMLASDV